MIGELQVNLISVLNRVARSSLATQLKNICASLLDQNITILVVVFYFKIKKRTHC